MQTPVILIVEDEDVTRLNLVSLFEAEGYKVIEAIVIAIDAPLKGTGTSAAAMRSRMDAKSISGGLSARTARRTDR